MLLFICDGFGGNNIQELQDQQPQFPARTPIWNPIGECFTKKTSISVNDLYTLYLLVIPSLDASQDSPRSASRDRVPHNPNPT